MATDLEKKSQDDKDLMSAIARGSQSELGQLYSRHRDSMLALAYRILGQWNLAEDICQEAFLRIRRAAPKYRPEAEFKTWAYRIIVNLCLDEKRRQKRTAASSPKIVELIRITEIHPVTEQEKAEKIVAVRKAVKKLNKRQQKAVVMHKIEGLSHAEISKKTGWSNSSIESLLVRAYRKLRKELSGQNEN